MTDADRQSLNERIALWLGWECISGWWFPKDEDTRHSGKPYLPDFTSEWNHSRLRWDEMVKALGYYDSTDRIEVGYINR